LVALVVSGLVPTFNLSVGEVRCRPQKVCLHIDVGEGLKNSAVSVAEIM
jgi:hypothetical protein